MPQTLAHETTPELVFGLVAPIGVDLGLVSDALERALDDMKYLVRTVKLTDLMREVPLKLPLADSPSIQSYKDRIAYANAVRQALGDEAMAALAISAIRTYRASEWPARRVARDSAGEPELTTRRDEETPLPSQAYIIRQLKRPEEVALLRSVYGRQFILVSAYAPEDIRQKAIEDRERASRGGLISDVAVRNAAYDLLAQDAKESLDAHGQNVRDAFPLGDVFIDTRSRPACTDAVQRFIYLLFGSNEITPTHDEYGMYLAKSASLRSSDLSRQVGAAIFRQSGEIATVGCNEVPKAGGGTYWAGDAVDQRDFVEGHDPNERKKIETLVDVIDRLKSGGFLSQELASIEDSYKIVERLLAERGERSVRESKVMDLIEFGRIIHAEMSAISDAARKGIPIAHSTLYCTTFPCHLCAKHIVAAGVARVVYIEPYAKSYASELHDDSIEVDRNTQTGKVSFDTFIGVSPYRYRDLFEKGKRKYASGVAQRWDKGTAHPMIEVYYPSYFEAEAYVVAELKAGIEKLTAND